MAVELFFKCSKLIIGKVTYFSSNSFNRFEIAHLQTSSGPPKSQTSPAGVLQGSIISKST